VANGATVRMINTAPDAPFGGFPDVPADPGTTGQVMQFVVNDDLTGMSASDPGGETPATPPQSLKLSLPDKAAWKTASTDTRDMALLEEVSFLVCVTVYPNGKIIYDDKASPDPLNPGTCIDDNGVLAASVPFGPMAAVLGTDGMQGGVATLWSDNIVTNPLLNSTETWELWNWSADAHPIHVHLVKYRVVDREAFDPETGTLLGPRPAEVTEAGWKDTVIAYPGEVTRFKATFDIAGLYVWHCHIVEHEDNEMMVPFCVVPENAPRPQACDVADDTLVLTTP
jgi:spore coat protein A